MSPSFFSFRIFSSTFFCLGRNPLFRDLRCVDGNNWMTLSSGICLQLFQGVTAILEFFPRQLASSLKRFYFILVYSRNFILKPVLNKGDKLSYLLLPVLLAAMEPTFLPGGACLETVVGRPGCCRFPPPCGWSTAFIATPRTPTLFLPLAFAAWCRFPALRNGFSFLPPPATTPTKTPHRR